MNEAAALDVIAVRALETADADRRLWADADREWASRAAAEIVGDRADAETFLARRAGLVLERLTERRSPLPRAFRAWRWRSWIGVLVVLGAFAAGAIFDQLANSRQINIMAPPVIGLVAWNLGVYVLLLARAAMRLRGPAAPGPFRRLVAWLGSAGTIFPRTAGTAGDARRETVAAFVHDWTLLSAPLHALRVVRIVHLAAAALAMGVIAGLYLRGLVFEYRALWQSTFLGAETVRSLLAVGYAPGFWLLQVPVPDAAQIAGLQAAPGENAAPWIHLMAATLLLVVVLPRLLLALVAAFREHLKAESLPLVITQPYFQRVLRGFHTGRARVEVLPYGIAVTTDGNAVLADLLARVLGGNVVLTMLPAVQYGDEAPAADTWPADDTDPLVVLFDLTATPEPEVHGRFLDVLAQHAWSRRLMIVLDESRFSSRITAPDRLVARRQLWTEFCRQRSMSPLSVNLEAPDLAAAEAQLDAILSAAEVRP